MTDDDKTPPYDHDRAVRSILQATDYLRDVPTYALRYRDPNLGDALRAEVDRIFPPVEGPTDKAEASDESESRDESTEEEVDSRTVPINA